jgi:hypothetical protein
MACLARPPPPASPAWACAPSHGGGGGGVPPPTSTPYIATSAGSPCALAPSAGLAPRHLASTSVATSICYGRAPTEQAGDATRFSTPRWSRCTTPHCELAIRILQPYEIPSRRPPWPSACRRIPATMARPQHRWASLCVRVILLFQFCASPELPRHRRTTAREVLSRPPLSSAVGQDSARLLLHPLPRSTPTWFPTPPLPQRRLHRP